MKKIIIALIYCLIITGILSGCNAEEAALSGNYTSKNSGSSAEDATSSSIASSLLSSATDSSESNNSNNGSDLFTTRDLEQTADLSSGKNVELTNNNNATISAEGVYILSGSYSNVTITVEAGDDDKVQLVLDGLTIQNETAPAIYVKSGDKVFITTTNSENSLSVSGTFIADGEHNLDAVIYSRSDIVLNGLGTLNVNCVQANGISSKDDIKITGGTYSITSATDSLEANDCIAVCGGTITIDSGKDGLHSENSDDLSLGHIYIEGGSFNITAKSDAIQGTGIVQIDDGIINVSTCSEGIEGTSVLINGGTIKIYATDDGINAANKSNYYDIVIEINNGNITIDMAPGDTDAVDSNGSIYVNGGVITITGNSSFDYDTTGEINGGTVTVNGTVITSMPSQMMGGFGGKRY